MAADRTARPADGLPRVGADEDLRDALGMLLSSGGEALVVEQDGQPIGLLSFDSVQRAIRSAYRDKQERIEV